jgi:hypothetical protein
MAGQQGCQMTGCWVVVLYFLQLMKQLLLQASKLWSLCWMPRVAVLC